MTGTQPSRKTLGETPISSRSPPVFVARAGEEEHELRLVVEVFEDLAERPRFAIFSGGR